MLCKKTSGLKCKKFAVLSSQDTTECCLQTWIWYHANNYTSAFQTKLNRKKYCYRICSFWKGWKIKRTQENKFVLVSFMVCRLLQLNLTFTLGLSMYPMHQWTFRPVTNYITKGLTKDNDCIPRTLDVKKKLSLIVSSYLALNFVLVLTTQSIIKSIGGTQNISMIFFSAW